MLLHILFAENGFELIKTVDWKKKVQKLKQDKRKGEKKGGLLARNWDSIPGLHGAWQGTKPLGRALVSAWKQV